MEKPHSESEYSTELHEGKYDKDIPRDGRNLHFSMNANGYRLEKNGWNFDSLDIDNLWREFEGQRISFFGPDAIRSTIKYPYIMFNRPEQVPDGFTEAFTQPSVRRLVHKIRQENEDEAERIMYQLGGIVSSRMSVSTSVGPKKNNEYTEVNWVKNQKIINDSVDFVARMAYLGDVESALPIASVMTLYDYEGGGLEEDRDFEQKVWYMGEAISNDPVVLHNTEDLGYSQVARATYYNGRLTNTELYAEDYSSEKKAFSTLPTVGAEFHIPLQGIDNKTEFLKQLALLNLTQYQFGSQKQLSRNDRDVYEVRMNPSQYPVTIANWEHMKRIVPQLEHSFFSITLNRHQENGDFFWENKKDAKLLKKLRSLCMLTYAASKKDVPPTSEKAEIAFGDIYLGQTVRVTPEEFAFTGLWGSEGGHSGQVSLYAGHGDNFPYLVNNLSIALHKPELLDVIPDTIVSESQSIRFAVNLPDHDIRKTLLSVRDAIASDSELMDIVNTGYKLHTKLRPALDSA